MYVRNTVYGKKCIKNQNWTFYDQVVTYFLKYDLKILDTFREKIYISSGVILKRFRIFIHALFTI